MKPVVKPATFFSYLILASYSSPASARLLSGRVITASGSNG